MPFYFKPIVWNTEGYRKPSGAKFASGFPAENGFGHEEWNNSEDLAFADGADRFKVFHTEGLGNEDLKAEAGRIAIMMIASNAGRQYLVAVAAGCTALVEEEDKPTRKRLAERLELDSDHMAAEAWALPSVQACFSNEAAFKKTWRADFHWIPNWTCPADLYLPLYEPVALDPQALTGKQSLVKMFGSYQPVDRSIFLRVLGQIPGGRSNPAVRRLADWAGADLDVARDLDRIHAPTETERAALIQARIGQGTFREQVMQAWNYRCAVTGCAVHEMLRASHVQPWRSSTNQQRLDPENGLMLGAHLDALFDRGLISFDDEGGMLVSSLLKPEGDSVWGVGQPLVRAPSESLKGYMAHHREQVFRP